MSNVTDDDVEIDIFQEPEGYLEPEKPFTFQSYSLPDGREISLRLVGSNPLWVRRIQGHYLWNGARVVSRHLLNNQSTLIHDKFVLELGAGAGLPSLVCATHGARMVVVTDYPDSELIENLQYNIDSCAILPLTKNITAMGYLWGASIAEVSYPLSEGNGTRFDILILADLLFNHSEHQKLVKTVRLTLARKAEAKALIFFTPYRPWLLEKDLAFFDLVESNHMSELQSESNDIDTILAYASGTLKAKKIVEEVMEDVMFKEDRGDELLRRTVYGYELFWADLQP